MSERIRVAICVPSSGQCSIFFAQSLAEMMMCGQVLRSRAEASGFDMRIFIRQSSNIPGNREALVDQAMEWGCTHVLFIDDDMVFNPNLLELVLSRRLPFVACNYPKRQTPFEFTATKADRSGHIQTTKASMAMEEAWYTGFGFCLIERQVFEKIPKPWFLPYFDPVQQAISTEDNPFCERVREAGFKVQVDHSASKHIGHYGNKVYTWEDNPESPAVPTMAYTTKAA
jgi:GT2 family glycosyltransferase